MSGALLSSKLYLPPPRAGAIPRPYLMARLDEGMSCPLTLIAAPAGYGKTTLISDWAIHRRRGTRVAWLSLDNGDNDIARFLTYLVAALQTVVPDLGAIAPALLQSSQSPALEVALTALINDLTPSTTPVALILDDYHLIETPAIHEALTFLLEHWPPALHLFIASRVDPPLPVTRLRARGQLIELHLSDLRFTPEEAAEFFDRILDRKLTTADITVLASRTEGWVAGLQLAAVSMQGRPDLRYFIRSFTGSNRFVFDYLAEEVFQRQSADVQDFLLRTSILKQLTAPLCDAVLNLSVDTQDRAAELSHTISSQVVLEYLDRSNLFIVPLDDERHWYRYHQLFADFLLARLQQAQPDQIADLHRRASFWHEQNQQMTEAITHALAAEDFARAAQLVEQIAEMTLLRSEVTTFLRWVEVLPADLMRTRPLLCVYHACAALLNGQPLNVVEARLQAARQADTAVTIASEIDVVRALVAAYRGETSQSIDLSQQALRLLPETRTFFRSVGNLGLVFSASNEGSAPTQALLKPTSEKRPTGNIMAMMSFYHLAERAWEQGQLHQAQVFYEQALAIATDEHGQRQPIACMALLGLASLLLEQNELEPAQRRIREGLDLAQRWGEIAAIQGYVDLARIRHIQGDVAGADEAIQAAQQRAKKFKSMKADDVYVLVNQARLWIGQSVDDPRRLEMAVYWAKERGLDNDLNRSELAAAIDRATPLQVLEYLTFVQICLIQKRLEQALAMLQLLLPTVERAGWGLLSVQTLALTALAQQACGDTALALTTLERALALAEPEGYVRVFMDESQPMVKLLRQAAARGIMLNYARKLLAVLDDDTQDTRRLTTPSSASLVEPLSNREREVLRLISTGLSNAEIAQTLVVANSTVKKHLKNIYGKLNVHSRTRAVARAQDLDLL